MTAITAVDRTTAILDVVRHGKTPYNELRLDPKTNKMTTMIQGNQPIPLSDVGVEQVTKLAHSLKDTHYDICYNSTFRRAEQSAEIIEGVFAAAGITLNRVVDGRIRERERGTFVNMLETEYDAAPKEARDLQTETDESITKRVFDFINEKGPKHLGERALVVSHERVICLIMRTLNPELKDKKIIVQNTAVLSIGFTTSKTSILATRGITIE